MKDDTIGKRLRTGISGQGWSIREFWRRMEKKAERMRSQGDRLPGVSYPSIRAFVEDKRIPTFAFLKAAAHELDVNYTWLVTGGKSGGDPFDWDELRRLREASLKASREAQRALQELAAFLKRSGA